MYSLSLSNSLTFPTWAVANNRSYRLGIRRVTVAVIRSWCTCARVSIKVGFQLQLKHRTTYWTEISNLGLRASTRNWGLLFPIKSNLTYSEWICDLICENRASNEKLIRNIFHLPLDLVSTSYAPCVLQCLIKVLIIQVQQASSWEYSFARWISIWITFYVLPQFCFSCILSDKNNILKEWAVNLD